MLRNKLKQVVLPMLILLIAALATTALKVSKPEAEEEKNEFPPLSVDVSPATLEKKPVSANFQGEVRAKTNIELVAQVTGKVVTVTDNFIEGGKFLAGETLLEIDSADYQVALKSAEASVASARVDLDMELASAETNARQWRDLQNKPLREANPLVLNKPQVDRATALLRAAEAELTAAQLNYDRTKISAPFDGRIMTKNAELGQFVSRGSSIGQVFSTESMEVRIPMTDLQISELGLTLGYAAPKLNNENTALKFVNAKISADFGIRRQEWDGYLKNVDASIDNETRLLYATIVVENTNQQSMPLAPGLFVDVELQSSATFSGLQVPRAALRNGNQVYVIKDDKLQIKPVSVIFTSSEWVILNDDKSEKSDNLLVNGEEVITSAVPGAHNGMRIKGKGTLLNADEVDDQAPSAEQEEKVMSGPDTNASSSS